jgi:large subunit ribosomal protein L22
MGKQSNPRSLADSEAKSVVRNLRVSPQKLNLVATMIRGLDVNKAIAALSFSRRRIADDVKKALQSAIANAENNHSLDVDRLFVKEAHVGKGLVMKRFRARAKGSRAHGF